ncbi:MAG: hypothetical protein RLZZ175_1921 [Bacteroidota bacterium]|jgi:L-asparaginase
MYKEIIINTAAPKDASKSVLLIYTGGTLGMYFNKESNALEPLQMEFLLEKIPELVLLDINIKILAFENPLDSSNITPEHWVLLASLIEQNYQLVDGFVIIHGTDTMAYTASALSYLLENLSKPVILTGAQLPIGAVRNDARENLITALEIASNAVKVPEVCILFNNFLLRGNRAKKIHSSHFDAFKSFNYPPLAHAGINISFQKEYFLEVNNKPLKVYNSFCNDVVLVKLYPGITENVFNAITSITDLKGIVLETYGAGNAPTINWLESALEKLIQKGIVVLNVSQCLEGKVTMGRYQTSTHLQRIGVLTGSDITTEAAITKMMFLLAQNLPLSELKEKITCSIRGEMSFV